MFCLFGFNLPPLEVQEVTALVLHEWRSKQFFGCVVDACYVFIHEWKVVGYNRNKVAVYSLITNVKK